MTFKWSPFVLYAHVYKVYLVSWLNSDMLLMLLVVNGRRCEIYERFAGRFGPFALEFISKWC